ncbi:nucleoside recognition domain-containing protein [Heyndrickxia sporothermodurans]|uniref:Nucleoside recognition domain-containing protein n=2 Tax=Heyndrickxia sporothermodurans TaxID=46224 RepID=A0AB37HD91_9BACI|nr:nucleoside recognition domain-containing protein [Heyndrickxia sporothermodurans]MBL5767073.1 nucleoside recognition domain-containing protein [Heyndrickxia sporothermodurans]MBL5770572.1 nucleoside recognition domain-containing protein [Heyndrickxia sporothermodurans]MBL5774542.1 nucleoside recognition domain-containing protein [Heyndrickxia sporothermodurans]MBL5777492.1 nucleoside recognition domain-containing protein [Heyndrickxia sporothermodurans]MBL5781119.1 nucleoside recognition do
MVQSLKIGIWSGLKTTWTLGKIIFPVTLIVAVLQYTPVLPWIIKLISPLMGIFGLSGDAAIPIVLGNFLNLYAGIAGILSVDLSVKEVFTIAVMLSFAHNLLIESSVAVKVGVKVWVMILVRVGLAILSALFINLVWHGGHETAQYGMIAPQDEQLSGIWAIAWHAVEKAALGVYQLAIIVIPLMVGIQILKDLKVLQWFSRMMAPFTRILGMKENTSTTLAAGLLFGLAYGAGVMIQAVKEDGVSKKDVTLAFIFLVGCHAVVEDTLIFVPLGIPVLPLLFIRLFTAILLTLIVGFIWNRREIAKNNIQNAFER